MSSVISKDATAKRSDFFRIIYGDNTGFVCIARRRPNTREMHEEFFVYPDELDGMLEYIQSFALGADMYYCPQLFDERERKKEHVIATPTIWADLDTCQPEMLLVEPTITIESSPRRFQALWLVRDVEPLEAEQISRNIAYYHKEQGADKSGWDLTQLLRIPQSHNYKYEVQPSPIVRIIKTGPTDYHASDFASYPPATGFEYEEIPFPTKLPEQDAEAILAEFNVHLPPQFWLLFNETPKEDWSRALWQVELFLAEAGMSREQTLVVAKEAACNKYKRDNRSDRFLWKDVCKAFAKHEERQKYLPTGEYKSDLAPLLTEEEREWCRANPTIVERYVEWAKTVGDAAWQYHQAGAFIVLSSLLAGRVRLPTSYGTVLPNLWFMILADTTLTRKTTAMDMAVDILVEVDADAVLATDGSIEGLMTSLSFRPGRPSLFLRDEFSGLLDAITKKDYYAGMAETLTKLYDGKFQKRVLKKETVEVRDPCLIFFAGGIKTRVLELLTAEQIASGFIPRFCLISAESDVASLKPLGPPTDDSSTERDALVGEIRKIANHYQIDNTVTVNERTISMPKKWDAKLTPEAWYRYNRYESIMLDAGMKAQHADLATPTFDRLSKSGLKCAILLASARNLNEQVLVTEDDIIRAFYYVELWRPHTLELLANVGQTASERLLNILLRNIRREPGITRSQLMQRHHLTAHQTDGAFMTLEQRGLIMRSKSGRTEKLSPAK